MVGVESKIIVKLAAPRSYDEYCRPVVIGDVRVFERGARVCDLEIPVQAVNKVEEADWTKGMPVLNQGDVDPEQAPFANISIESRHAYLNMLKTTIELYQAGRIGGSCFAPLNKQAAIQARRPFEDEHHYMTHLFGHTDPFGGINILGDLQTTRTTNHIPINKASEGLTTDTIMKAIRLTNISLKSSDVEKPRLALAALSPHRDEGGECGREEIDVIAPAIEKARGMRVDVDGPFPPDILLVKAFNGDLGGVVTMYRDQGQIALKLERFDQGITIAGSLPAPIVTCVHSAVYNITGKGVVRVSTFENAIKMAAKMATHLKDC